MEYTKDDLRYYLKPKSGWSRETAIVFLGERCWECGVEFETTDYIEYMYNPRKRMMQWIHWGCWFKGERLTPGEAEAQRVRVLVRGVSAEKRLAMDAYPNEILREHVRHLADAWGWNVNGLSERMSRDLVDAFTFENTPGN
jgi:hypothetical protein